MEAFFSQGVVPALVVVIFVLIDKVLVPLVRKKTNGDENGYRDKRIERLEADVRELRSTVSAIGTAVEVSQAILKRIEDGVNSRK